MQRPPATPHIRFRPPDPRHKLAHTVTERTRRMGAKNDRILR